MGGHIHDEHVADTPAGAQSRGRRHDRSHQFVGVQAAFHQRLDLAGACHGHGLLGRGMTVLGRNNAVGRKVDAFGFGHRANFGLWPDQHRFDQSAFGRLNGTEQ